MNPRQKVCMVIGIMGLVAIFLFPPWQFVHPQFNSASQFIGFAFIGSPPDTGYIYNGSIDHMTLMVEILIWIAITSCGFLLMKDGNATV
jgi:hypothetical protein